MLFNSYVFIFLFLPWIWVFFTLLPASYRLRFLLLASLGFYAYFSLSYLLLLCVSICFNYAVALWLENTRDYKKVIFSFSILLNLLPLAYFKYALTSDTSILFPLALSFYTFQQIAFLIDVYQKKVQTEGLERYAFFVLFFPQLVAGPIVHYKELISQIGTKNSHAVSQTMLSSGLFLFSMGLFKKVALADLFLEMAADSFSAVASLQTLDAWVGLFAYSLGIYFDFSAYSDMAIGLGLLFGFALPVNFMSPYKARSIVEFWRHWHMTLSHFLKHYLYIALGGNRHGKGREIAALLLTMTLAGIWHGTGWTFLLWGFGHGVLLVLVHVYRHFFKDKALPFVLAVVLTFMSVTLLWVLFRAESLSDALLYYQILFGGAALGSYDIWEVAFLLVGLGIVWFLPNSMQVLKYPKLRKLGWKDALFTVVLAFVAVHIMADAPARSFVYFNF